MLLWVQSVHDCPRIFEPEVVSIGFKVSQLQSFYLDILNFRFLELIFPFGTLRIRIPLWLKSNSENVDL